MAVLTVETVRELLDYDYETGALSWRYRDRKHFGSDRICNSWNSKHAGKPAFTAVLKTGLDRSARYHIGKLGPANYLAHRVAFLWMMGRWPIEIDHVNRIGTDNRWENLREVTHAENGKNASRMRQRGGKPLKFAHAGIDQQGDKFIAYINVGGRRIRKRTGTYDEAVTARQTFERDLGFSVGHGKPRGR